MLDAATSSITDVRRKASLLLPLRVQRFDMVGAWVAVTATNALQLVAGMF